MVFYTNRINFNYIATFEIIYNELWVIDILSITSESNRIRFEPNYVYGDEFVNIFSEIFDGVYK